MYAFLHYFKCRPEKGFIGGLWAASPPPARSKEREKVRMKSRTTKLKLTEDGTGRIQLLAARPDLKTCGLRFPQSLSNSLSDPEGLQKEPPSHSKR